jgi:hypothetical protein
VPTPFYHLDLAEELLRQPTLNPLVKKNLVQVQCSFLLGNTAPDVQVISGKPRQATHFFTLPIPNGSKLPWEQLLEDYPQLSDAQTLHEEQAAFIAGYLCHLQADWYWIKKIYWPYFGPAQDWGTHVDRLYLHNVLRTYLEEKVIKSLSVDQWTCFRQISNLNWLPFVEQKHLGEWSTFLAQQLHPGGRVQTVEVFAERQGLPVEEFYSLLLSEERMEREIFAHFPRKVLTEYRQDLFEANVRLLNNYLAPDHIAFQDKEIDVLNNSL